MLDASRNFRVRMHGFPPSPPPPSQPLNLTKKRINKKEIMEANEGKYTFGAVISGWKLAIWIFWCSYLCRDISELSKRLPVFEPVMF